MAFAWIGSPDQSSGRGRESPKPISNTILFVVCVGEWYSELIKGKLHCSLRLWYQIIDDAKSGVAFVGIGQIHEY